MSKKIFIFVFAFLKMVKKSCFIIIIMINCTASLLAQEAKGGVKKNTITIENKTLTLEEIIDRVLQENLTLQAAKFDIVMTDSETMKFDGKYGTTANLEGGYSRSKIPDKAVSPFTGQKSYSYSATASLSKMFSTATTVKAGVSELFFDSNDESVPNFMEAAPAYHKPSFFVSVRQELLKNAFGMNDRKERDILEKTKQIQRAEIIDKLAGLIVSSLVDYWSVSVKKSAMNNAQIELNSDKEVRDIIARNTQYGLAESYDLNQYNALVAGAEVKLAASSKLYRDAVRKFLRTVNMSPDTEVKEVTELRDNMPKIEKDRALEAAFNKRTDYKNAVFVSENARKSLAMQKNNTLPSLTLGADVSTWGQDESYPPAFRDSASTKYPNFEVTAKLTYPLDNKEQEMNLRNAYLRMKQADYNLESIKVEVRDDVVSNIEGVELQHVTLQKARVARKESEVYYQKLLVRFRQGKINSAVMKLALDSMVQSKQQELEALVGFNIALLQLDLAKNEVFERYSIDVEKYLAKLMAREK